jgi:hypothetical protein
MKVSLKNFTMGRKVDYLFQYDVSASILIEDQSVYGRDECTDFSLSGPWKPCHENCFCSEFSGGLAWLYQCLNGEV